MESCLGCLYWSKEEYDGALKWKETHDGGSWGFCTLQGANPDIPFDALCISEGIGGQLLTRSDFGCALQTKLLCVEGLKPITKGEGDCLKCCGTGRDNNNPFDRNGNIKRCLGCNGTGKQGVTGSVF